ncbi:MAG: hypothetical protein QOD62_587 [Actinomycetota bacterium]|jgi:hypothetical protein|nr:hypothetical protein [Actinomycetota bacterium]
MAGRLVRTGVPALLLSGALSLGFIKCHSWSSHFDLSLDGNCSSSTGEPTVCKERVTNNSDSSGTFAWKFSSDPSVATAVPDTGEVQRGKQSEEIVVTAPPDSPCPIAFTFSDEHDQASVSGQIQSTNGLGC